MRSWTYSYKTSDGLRHEDEMAAPNKDAVYAALRERGIRAIRVDERIAPVVRRGFRGLRKRDWFLIFFCVLVVLATVVVVTRQKAAPVVTMPELPRKPAIAELKNPQFQKLAKSLGESMDVFRESAAAIDLALLSDYNLALTPAGETRIRREIEKGRKVAEAGRQAVRGVYDLLYATIPAACTAETETAQRLFGEALSEIDALAEGLDGGECAVSLLAENRGAWRVLKNGEVEWQDPKFTRAFQVFKRASDARIRPLKKNSTSPLTGDGEKW